MQFPLINSAINLTLMYYDKQQIVIGVNEREGSMQRAGLMLNGKNLPHWHNLVLNSHAQMEDEIKQIISLNYPYVQSIVFEDLRQVLTDVRIKSLNKELIIKIVDENNEAELLRFANQNQQGFAITINKDFLPEYFRIVDNAISNLKRIINKYLNLYDSNKLPSSYPLPNYVPNSNATIGKALDTKLKVSIKVEELTVLFRLLKECKVIDSNFDQIHAFIAENFTTDSTNVISKKNVKKLWSSKDPDTLTYLSRLITDMGDKLDRK